MFGITFAKFQPTTYVLQYKNGKIVREGTGLSFFYFAPSTSLVAVPVGSVEAPFIFEEITSDFQTVSLQGQASYRIAEPRKIAGLLNFSLEANGRAYASEDPEKLSQRVVNTVQVLARDAMQRLTLRQAVRAAEEVVGTIRTGLAAARELTELGLEILGLSIQAVKPNPETSRALEAETREQLLQKADEATYVRRNAAVEQERAIKENELNTEIAVENKQRQIRETKMEAERAVQEKRHQLEKAALEAQIGQEEKRKQLVEAASLNTRTEADARAYGLQAVLKGLGSVDARVLQALANAGMNPEQLIANAFQEIAGRADKIGQLNISPDLLRELMGARDPKR